MVDIFVPVVVVDGQLFEAYLGDNFALEVRPITRGVLVWRNPVSGRPNTIIHVVNLPEYADFVQGARISFETLISCLKQV